ncbi:helix-turn-helix domain-containing protein [Salinifilum ghardaiensis]
MGAELRNLRKAQEMTTRSVGEQLGTSAAWVSRTENSSRIPGEDEVRALCALYGASEQACQELVDKARGEDSASMDLPSGDEYTDQLANIMLLETQARTVTEFELALVPGLLQTAGYARAVFATVERSEAELERRATTRLSRQSLLTRPNGPQLCFLLDEFVLHRRIGGPSVMQRQLRTVLDGSELPNVHVRVIPSSAGAHAGLDGPFALYEFAALNTYVYLENRQGGIFLTDSCVARNYVRARDELWRQALDEEGTRELIAELMERRA